jgi:hypothetical protein
MAAKYAIRSNPHSNYDCQTLIELAGKWEIESLRELGYHVQLVDAAYARNWVKRGWHHSTPLYVDGNRVRYAG